MIEALGVDRRHLYGKPEDKAAALELFNGKTTRQAMQTLGTEWGRHHIDADFWVRAWAHTLPAQGAVADDVRFANEAHEIKRRGGMVVCIVRDLKDFDRVPAHDSENFAAVPRDVVVLNDKCPTILEQRLIVALQAATLASAAG